MAATEDGARTQYLSFSLRGTEYAVGILKVKEILQFEQITRVPSTPRSVRGVINLRGKPLPYRRLRDHFALEGARPDRENGVVVQHGAQAAGIVVDELHGESSTVIKPLGSMFKQIPGVAGSSILGNGRVALILDVAGILRETLRRVAARDAAVA